MKKLNVIFNIALYVFCIIVWVMSMAVAYRCYMHGEYAKAADWDITALTFYLFQRHTKQDLDKLTE